MTVIWNLVVNACGHGLLMALMAASPMVHDTFPAAPKWMGFAVGLAGVFALNVKTYLANPNGKPEVKP